MAKLAGRLPEPSVTTKKADAKPKPSGDEYDELVRELEAIQKRLLSLQDRVAQAIFPGPKATMRQDAVDWVKWTADDQIGGMVVWLEESKVGEGDADLQAAVAAEARAEDAERA